MVAGGDFSTAKTGLFRLWKCKIPEGELKTDKIKTTEKNIQTNHFIKSPIIILKKLYTTDTLYR